VTTAYDAPHDEMDERRFTPTKIGLGAIVVVSVVFWAWIFLFSSRDNPDRLVTRSFPAAAEAICAPAQVAYASLPLGNNATTPQERARQIELGSAITVDLVDALKVAAESVTDEGDLRLLTLWFEDWDAYIEDRAIYVAKLDAATVDTPNRELIFTLRERAAGGTYTRRIDGFGNVNDMASCRTPGDI
jgi:hypothetical protein